MPRSETTSRLITAVPVIPSAALDLPVVATLPRDPSAGRRIEGPSLGLPHAETPPAAENEPAESHELAEVRRTLRSYEDAYERLDVAAAAQVWPTVDRGTLSRAFSALASQGLEFRSCSIVVTDARATARCRGTLQVVRKVGNPVPLIAEQQWLFELTRNRSAWTIDRVTTSQTSGLAAGAESEG